MTRLDRIEAHASYRGSIWLTGMQRDDLRLLVEVAREALNHSCYMHGIGEGPRDERGIECRMCNRLAPLRAPDNQEPADASSQGAA
jgi:hypothetical protein